MVARMQEEILKFSIHRPIYKSMRKTLFVGVIVLPGCFHADADESDSLAQDSESSDTSSTSLSESSSSSSSSSSGSSEAETSDPDFTPDGCYKWSEQVALQDAVGMYDCVEVQPGTWMLGFGVAMPPGKTLRGVSAEASVLRANPASWTFGCCDSVVSDTLPADPAANPFHVSNLTIDGGGVATYDLCCRGYEVENTILRNSRCSALGAAGPGVVARGNLMTGNAQPTQIPEQGLVTCATGGFGGVAEGAAVYSEAQGVDLGSVFENNTIENSYGPALDINGAWGGTFSGNNVYSNAAWAAVSLYGASGWTIEYNTISHPGGPPQPYHPYCATGPAGGQSAGIFLCQDTDINGLTTNDNLIKNNVTSSFYGILSVGADEVQPYWAPRNNTFIGNDVFGSVIGCADDFALGQWLTDVNVWSGNNCAGPPDTGPATF